MLPVFIAPGVTRVAGASAGGAQANNVTLGAVEGKTTYLCGFVVTGAGATAASVIAVTVTGLLGGTQTFYIAVPAGAAVGIAPLVVQFPAPIPASGTNQAIAVNVPSFGAGNTSAATAAHGFRA